jgi:hypothetical protein
MLVVQVSYIKFIRKKGEGSEKSADEYLNDGKRRKIRLIESNAKRHYLKKLTWKGTLRQVFYLSEAPSLPMTPYSPPLTHCILAYLFTCILVYLFTQGGGGGTLREKVRGEKFTREVENTNI